MNILIITGHPAQIHNFKHLKWELEKKGHKIFWLASDKEISKYLLEKYDIEYKLLPKPGKSVLSKAIHLIKNTLFLVRFLLKHKIDLTISRVSPYASLACFFLRKRHFTLTDTETAGIYDKVFGKLVTELFTANSFRRQLRKNQIRFDANIELFYLHPNRFQPMLRNEVESLLGIQTNQPYVVMRFVSWDAYHDKGLTGFTDANKIKAVEEFSKYAKVFISAEGELPEALKAHQINIPYERMHDVLAHGQMFFGESSTMASESSVLGVPAVYLNENWFGSTDEEADAGLLFPFRESLEDQKLAIQAGSRLLSCPQSIEKFHENHKKFLENKIDATGFMLWFIENYPTSVRIMRENPDYPNNFR